MMVEGSWTRTPRLPKRARMAASAGEALEGKGWVAAFCAGSIVGRVGAARSVSASRSVAIVAAVVAADIRNWRRFMFATELDDEDCTGGGDCGQEELSEGSRVQ